MSTDFLQAHDARMKQAEAEIQLKDLAVSVFQRDQAILQSIMYLARDLDHARRTLLRDPSLTALVLSNLSGIGRQAAAITRLMLDEEHKQRLVKIAETTKDVVG